MYAHYKKKAIELRKQGKTYREILFDIPVAKSTLSRWLRSVGLSIPQKQRITQARIDAALRGAQSRRRMRLEDIERTKNKGIKDIGALTNRDIWLIGTALYWAEGSKQNTRSVSSGLIFTNSDPRMIRVYVAWLALLGIKSDAIRYCLYVHVDRKADTEYFREWWSKEIGIPDIPQEQVYFKKGNIKTRRSNVGDLYHGIVRITVKSSTSLNRQVDGWISGICASMGSGVIGNTSAFEAEDSRIVP